MHNISMCNIVFENIIFSTRFEISHDFIKEILHELNIIKHNVP